MATKTSNDLAAFLAWVNENNGLHQESIAASGRKVASGASSRTARGDTSLGRERVSGGAKRR
jgi:hypothetical protein